MDGLRGDRDASLRSVWAEKGPLNLAIVWHQHQPLYWNRLTDEYELPWVRVHGVQEYIWFSPQGSKHDGMRKMSEAASMRCAHSSEKVIKAAVRPG